MQVDPKPRTPRDKTYLAWLRTRECSVPGCYRSPCEPAHTVGTGGKSLKRTDYGCIPLCDDHHREQHKGDKTFARNHGINVWETAFRLYHQWTTGQRV